jgi:hypothetical protein
MAKKKSDNDTESPTCVENPNPVESVFRRFLPFLEIADPILRLASGKNPNIAPISAVVNGVVTSLKKHFAAGKKVNPAALNNILDLLKGVDPKMSKKDADAFLANLKKNAENLEAAK